MGRLGVLYHMDTCIACGACQTACKDGHGLIAVSYTHLEVYKRQGDVLGVARIAGIMAVKRTWEFIPLCHPLMVSKVDLNFIIPEDENSVVAECSVGFCGRTGVEMEAITGVAAALLTIYDMCKGFGQEMAISDIHLVHKEEMCIRDRLRRFA